MSTAERARGNRSQIERIPRLLNRNESTITKESRAAWRNEIQRELVCSGLGESARRVPCQSSPMSPVIAIKKLTKNTQSSAVLAENGDTPVSSTESSATPSVLATIARNKGIAWLIFELISKLR